MNKVYIIEYLGVGNVWCFYSFCRKSKEEALSMIDHYLNESKKNRAGEYANTLTYRSVAPAYRVVEYICNNEDEVHI